jgi:hypothetical protein
MTLLVIGVKRSKIATNESRVVTSKLLVNQWRSAPSSRGGVSRIFMAFPSGSMVSSVNTHGPYPCASAERTSASEKGHLPRSKLHAAIRGGHLSGEWGTRRDPLMSYGARNQPELPMPLAVRALPCMPLSLSQRRGFG